jgi:hypothetical protein
MSRQRLNSVYQFHILDTSSRITYELHTLVMLEYCYYDGCLIINRICYVTFLEQMGSLQLFGGVCDAHVLILPFLAEIYLFLFILRISQTRSKKCCK